jgi:hypothetical protein
MARQIFILLIAASAVLVAGVSPARADASREYQLKAAFLYNFAQFVEWPADAFASGDAPIVIGVLGDNPFGGALEQAVRGKSVNGRGIQIRYYPSIESIDRCHVLFVSSSQRFNTAAVLQKAGDSTLTVGDYDGFTRDGGLFRFLTEANKVRFEVNLDAAQRSRLKISSKLLKLAKIYGQ